MPLTAHHMAGENVMLQFGTNNLASALFKPVLSPTYTSRTSSESKIKHFGTTDCLDQSFTGVKSKDTNKLSVPLVQAWPALEKGNEVKGKGRLERL